MTKTRKSDQKLSSEAVKAFMASLFVSMNVPTAFVLNDANVRRALATLMQEHHEIRPFGPPLISPGGSGTFYDWFRDECVDVVDKGRDLVRLNDTCLNYANEGRALLSTGVIETLRRVGPEFYRLNQLPA